MAVAIAAFIPLFFFFGVYAAIFRFAGLGTIRDLARAVAVYAVVLVAAFMINSVPGVPRTIALIHPILFLGAASLSRVAIRQLLNELASGGTGRPPRRGLIYGAGGAGIQLALSLRHVPELTIVGFVDDDFRLAGQRLEGVRVSADSELEKVIEAEGVDIVLLAIPSATRKRRREIIERLEPLTVEVKTLPQVQNIVNGRVSFDDLREVQIDDLLGRDMVEPNAILLQRTIVDKTVLVTGAGGSIGSELCRQIVGLRPRRLILAEMTEHALYQIEGELNELLASGGSVVPIEPELLSLVDKQATDRLFKRWKPDTVFHAAAYKHVPLVERNVLSGLRNNIMGTRNAALAARDAGVERFVLISTDKAVRPTNVMGASKRVCEQILQSLSKDASGTRFAMVRFGNVLGSSGSVVPRFKRQIREGGPVTITHRDVTRFFMTIPEAAQLVIQAGAMARGGEVYLLDMGESIRIVDLAHTMISLSGLTVRDEANQDGEIEIVEVGLRPGEKLYEELLIDAEAEETLHPRIRRAHEAALDGTTLEKLLSDLLGALHAGDRSAALDVLKKLVPEYVSEETVSDSRSVRDDDGNAFGPISAAQEHRR
ncbi:polysaccharide biosynthesis protein [Tsuneonella sp. HG249]